MKPTCVSLMCLIAIASASATTVTPKGKLYLASSDQYGGSTHIVVIQGNSITTFPQAYNPGHELPIAVFGDIRTTGNRPDVDKGGQYDLTGTSTGVTYTFPTGMNAATDSTSDGTYNYLVDYNNLNVIRTDRDFTNPVPLFSVSPMPQPSGITYDSTDQTLWISYIGSQDLQKYSMKGALLKSIDAVYAENAALAFDPSDGTLWVVNGHTGYLEQFSTSGQALGLGPYVGPAYGAEFNLATTFVPSPEPGTLALFGSGILRTCRFCSPQVREDRGRKSTLKALTPLIAALVVACSGLSHASVTPKSKLYLTGNKPNGNGEQILVVQGQSTIISADTAYSNEEWPIAVYGDVRTTGSNASNNGGFYDLTVQASPFVQYTLPSFMRAIYDSTSDGTHNYMVDLATVIVYQTARDYTNATTLFTLNNSPNLWSGITYDPTNHSLWFVAHDSNLMADYSLNGTLLSSFNVQNSTNGPLAFDPADHTLWLVNYASKNLEQYSTSGQFLGIDPGYWGIGAEFNLETIGLNPTPEPGSLIMFGSGVLGFAGLLRRKTNL